MMLMEKRKLESLLAKHHDAYKKMSVSGLKINTRARGSFNDEEIYSRIYKIR